MARMFTREVAQWLKHDMPGCYKVPGVKDGSELLTLAFNDFKIARRVKDAEGFNVADFTQALDACGYKIETRTNHSTGETFPLLALPEPSRHF